MTFVDQMYPPPPQTAILKGHSWVMLAKNMQTDKTLLSLLSEKFCVCIQITKQLRELATTQPTIPNNSKKKSQDCIVIFPPLTNLACWDHRMTVVKSN